MQGDLRRIRSLLALAAVLALALLAPACGDDDDGSDAPAAVSTATETTATSADSDQASSLFVAAAENGTLKPAGQDGSYTLTLADADASVVVFTDRPERRAGSEPVAGFVAAWETCGFADDPPNAALEVLAGGSAEPVSGVFELANPRYEEAANTLTFDATELGADASTTLAGFASENGAKLPTSFGEASLFIDDASADTTGDAWTLVGGNGSATVTFDQQTLQSLNVAVGRGGGSGGQTSPNSFSVRCNTASCVLIATFTITPDKVPITGTVAYTGGVKLRYYSDGGGSYTNLDAGKFSVTPSE